MRTLFILTVLCASAVSAADLAYLLDGVKEIVASQNRGSLCVFGEQAFAVVDGQTANGTEEPAIAAARFKKGRMVAMTGYLENTSLQVADTPRFMSNIARWAAGEKKSPKAGVYKQPALAVQLRQLGLDARDITLDQRSTVDVVFLVPRGISDAEVPVLLDYVANGGGLVAAAIGWIWQGNHPDKTLIRDFTGTRLFAPAGIVWTVDELQQTSRRGYSTEKPPAELAHARKALEAADAFAHQGRILDPMEQEQVYTTLFAAARSLPPADLLLRPQIEKLAGTGGKAIPSATEPIHKDWLRARLGIALDHVRLQQLRPEQITAHPAAAQFPGSVSASVKRVTQRVTVHTARKRWGWFGTGLYAPPGELITVTLPEFTLGRDLMVRIGAHTDTLWDLERWERFPEIFSRTPVEHTMTKAANAFGGLIYIRVPEGHGLDDFTVTIAGGVPSPRFVLGETSVEEWRNTIRKRPAPWGEIESDKVILTEPASLLRSLDDPVALMELWNKIADLETDLAARPHERLRAERMVADVQVGGKDEEPGAHSGYPIVIHMPAGRNALDRDGLLACNNGWLLFHELGHNVQNEDWILEESANNSVNLFGLYVFEHLCNLPVAFNPRVSAEHRAQQMAKYDFTKPSFTKWQNDAGLGFTMYVQLQQAFGWDAYRKVFAEYLALPKKEHPRNAKEKQDQWVVRFSRQVGRDLGPFFAAWGIPVSDSARKAIADLPGWMPAEIEQRLPAAH